MPTVQEWLQAAFQPHRLRSYKPRLGLSRGEIGIRGPVPDHWVVHAFRANAIPYLYPSGYGKGSLLTSDRLHACDARRRCG